jgi:hypothetical protein
MLGDDMTDLYYADPVAVSPLKMMSRMVGDAVVPSHDVEGLPGTVEADIGSSNGFLATIAGAIAANRMGVDLTAAVTGYLQTLAGAVASGNMKVLLQTGSAAIGKLAANAGVVIGTVNIVTPTASALTVVPSSISSVTLLAANANRIGAIIANNSPVATLNVKFGTGASLTSWSFQILPGGYWEMPPRYCVDIITGIWTSVSGDAHVTETA